VKLIPVEMIEKHVKMIEKHVKIKTYYKKVVVLSSQEIQIVGNSGFDSSSHPSAIGIDNI
jgi:hypothetical protein